MELAAKLGDKGQSRHQNPSHSKTNSRSTILDRRAINRDNVHPGRRRERAALIPQQAKEMPVPVPGGPRRRRLAVDVLGGQVEAARLHEQLRRGAMAPVGRVPQR